VRVLRGHDSGEWRGVETSNAAGGGNSQSSKSFAEVRGEGGPLKKRKTYEKERHTTKSKKAVDQGDSLSNKFKPGQRGG